MSDTIKGITQEEMEKMTSKEALDELLFYATLDDSGFEPYMKEYANQIKKDLEVLEILKNQITITEERKDDDFGNYTNYTMIYNLNITTAGLNWEQFDKIRKWLNWFN